MSILRYDYMHFIVFSMLLTFFFLMFKNYKS